MPGLSSLGRAVGSAAATGFNPIGLIGPAADVLGGLIGSRGQRDANRMNLQIAREQMAFQEMMSSTAVQRRAKDLEAAGLNKILAAGSQASSPPGQSAVMQNEKATIGEKTARAAHTALALRNMEEQNQLLREQQQQTRAATAKTWNDADYVAEQTSVTAKDYALRHEQVEETKQRIRNLEQEFDIKVSTSRIQKIEADLQEAIFGGDMGEVVRLIHMLGIPASMIGAAARYLFRGSRKSTKSFA